MVIARIGLCLAVLLLGLPLGALEAPLAPSPQSGSATAPIWLAAGPDAAALPENGTPRQAPEVSAITALAGTASPGDSCEPLAAASGRATLRVPPRLYLSHCAFLC